MALTHSELVECAKKWLIGTAGCAFAVGEVTAWTGETPDAIGFKSDMSVLVEVKCSRSDFLADAKKPFRKNQDRGMGDHRYFMCEEGIIKPDDTLNGWGLLYVKNGRVRKIVCPISYEYIQNPRDWGCNRPPEKIKGVNWNKRQFKKSISKENTLLISIARRLAQECPYIKQKIAVKQ